MQGEAGVQGIDGESGPRGKSVSSVAEFALVLVHLFEEIMGSLYREDVDDSSKISKCIYPEIKLV